LIDILPYLSSHQHHRDENQEIPSAASILKPKDRFLLVPRDGAIFRSAQFASRAEPLFAARQLLIR
jgi:hypothetical protein